MEALETSGWRPVSEIPKPVPDGLTILLIDEDDISPLRHPMVARWYAEEDCWVRPGTNSGLSPWSDYSHFLVLPDHTPGDDLTMGPRYRAMLERLKRPAEKDEPPTGHVVLLYETDGTDLPLGVVGPFADDTAARAWALRRTGWEWDIRAVEKPHESA